VRIFKAQISQYLYNSEQQMYTTSKYTAEGETLQYDCLIPSSHSTLEEEESKEDVRVSNLINQKLGKKLNPEGTEV